MVSLSQWHYFGTYRSSTGLLAYSGQGANAIFEVFTDVTVPTQEASADDAGMTDETGSTNEQGDATGNQLF